MKSANEYNLFLSYRRADNIGEPDGFVTELHGALEKVLGENVFMDKLDLKRTGIFPDELRDAIDNCRVFLPIVTANYLNFEERKESDDWCKEEIAYAISSGKIIVPIICDDTLSNNSIKIDGFDWQKDSPADYDSIRNNIEYIIKVLKSLQQNDAVAVIGKQESMIDIADEIAIQIYDRYDAPFVKFLNKQMESLNSITGLAVEYLTALEKCRDFGISGKLTAKEKKEAQEKQREGDRAERDPEFDFAHFSLGSFINKFIQERRAVVIGDAGQGKSVYLKKICGFFTNEVIENQYNKESIFPIYIELKKFNEIYQKLLGDNTESVLGKEQFFFALSQSCKAIASKSMLEWLARNGRMCFLFDGMDEIAPKNFKAIHETICKYLDSDNMNIVFASRPKQELLANEYKDFELGTGNTVRRWVLDEISDVNLKKFLQARDNISKEDVDDWFDAIKEKEAQNNDYRALSRNPLTLNVILNISNSKVLPKSKVEVYDKAVQSLLERDDSKQIESLSLIEQECLKEELGHYAYDMYRKQDGEIGSINNIVERLRKNMRNPEDEAMLIKISRFLENHRLVDDNGFSHDLFQTYYCAFYIYRCLCKDNNKANKNEKWGEKRLEKIIQKTDKQYWAGVVEMLICLVEYYANPDDENCATIRQILLKMFENMQNEKLLDNHTPNYDILCGAVTEFVYQENRAECEKILILGMLKRGARGILKYNLSLNIVEEGSNPYEELFYYVVEYNWKDALESANATMEENLKDIDKTLVAIYRHLMAELCEIMHVEIEKKRYRLSYRIMRRVIRASSQYRFLPGFCFSLSKLLKWLFKSIVSQIEEDEVSLIDIIEDEIDEISEKASLRGHIVYPYGWAGALLAKVDMPCTPSSVTFSRYSILRDIIYSFELPIYLMIIVQMMVDPLGFLQPSLCSVSGIKRLHSNTWIYRTWDDLLITRLSKKLVAIGANSKHIKKYEGDTNTKWRLEVPRGVKRLARNNDFRGFNDIILPNGLKKISSDVFEHSKLETIAIPKSVKSIGRGAFSYSDKLKSVVFETGSRLKHIGKYAFYDCSSLFDIKMPVGIKNIGDCAFSHCAVTHMCVPGTVKRVRDIFPGNKLAIVELCNGVRKIDSRAFRYERHLVSVTLPKSLKFIGEDVFDDCDMLIEVINKSHLKIDVNGIEVPPRSKKGSTIVNKDDFLFTTIEAGGKNINLCVGYMGKEADLVLPEYCTDDGYYIMGRAFNDFRRIRSITIPPCVKGIGADAFKGCYKLIEVQNRSSLNIKAGGKSNGCVGYYAKHIYSTDGESRLFVDNDGYVIYKDNGEEILVDYEGESDNPVLPGGITQITSHSFSNVTSITIPDGVTKIGDYAFSAENIYISNLKNWCAIDSRTFGTYNLYLDDNLLQNLQIPYGITEVGDGAFSGCKSLIKADIPNGVVSIGKDAFGFCYNLSSVRIPDSVTSVGDMAFLGCSESLSIHITDINKWCAIDFKAYRLDAILYINEERPHGNIVIQEGAISIPPSTFRGCSDLSSISIPSSITHIGTSAFAWCTGISSITIPSSVISVSERAFCGCSALTTVNWDAIACIGYMGRPYAGGEIFEACEKLTTINIGKHVKIIPEYAFYMCNGISDITIPDSVTSIGESAFEYCTGLTNMFYMGTVEEWHNISKGGKWDAHTGNYVVQCIDGTIKKSSD